MRLIARLDIKGEKLIKGVQFEGLRVIGDPHEHALKYADQADELLYIDTVATLYGRNHLEKLIEKVTEEIFIPITVGGGISTIHAARSIFRFGGDKIAINSAGIKNPDFINKISEQWGKQSLCVSIEAKRTPHGWEAYTDNGRERTHKDAVKWAFEAVERGAGELLITSIDQDGTMKGFDIELIRAIAPNVSVPVIAAGGMGSIEHLQRVIREGKADAVAMASCLHYGRVTLQQARDSIQLMPRSS